MSDSDAPWEPRPAYPQLHALACAMRAFLELTSSVEYGPRLSSP